MTLWRERREGEFALRAPLNAPHGSPRIRKRCESPPRVLGRVNAGGTDVLRLLSACNMAAKKMPLSRL